MPIERLDHCSIRTFKLDDTTKFYTELLGLTVGPRPTFPFPGVWLYQGDRAVVHVVGIDPNDTAGLHAYLGDKGVDGAAGTGTIDHIAFYGSDAASIVGRLRAAGCTFRERHVPSLDLHQVFVEDPNGVTLELNYPGSEAAAAAP